MAKKKFDDKSEGWDDEEDNPKLPKELKELFDKMFFGRGGGGGGGVGRGGGGGLGGIMQIKVPTTITMKTTVRGERDGLFRRKYTVEVDGFDPIVVAMSLDKGKLSLIKLLKERGLI